MLVYKYGNDICRYYEKRESEQLKSVFLTLRALSFFLTLTTLLQIYWSPFTLCSPNLAPFPTWSTTLATSVLGLESLQATNSNSVFSLF